VKKVKKSWNGLAPTAGIEILDYGRAEESMLASNAKN
jgi:hypothetical protein